MGKNDYRTSLTEYCAQTVLYDSHAFIAVFYPIQIRVEPTYDIMKEYTEYKRLKTTLQ